MFKHILLPTDGSATSQRSAVEVAELIQAGSPTRVTLILVVGSLKPEDTDFDEEIVQRHNAAMFQKAEGILETAASLRSVASNAKRKSSRATRSPRRLPRKPRPAATISL